MLTNIQKALRGNADAMIELYQCNKQQVFYLCYTLLGDSAEADRAITQIFKNAWELLLDGKIDSEKKFTDTVIKKAVNYCKNKISKKDQKLFRIPQNKNFSATQYSSESIATNGDACGQILSNLPVLHRFIYVCSALAGWSQDEIATLIRSNKDTVRIALEAEETNITKICDCIKKNTGEYVSLSVDEFHDLLLVNQNNAIIPKAVDSVVFMTIDSLATPIAVKRKRKLITVFATVIGAVLLSILLIIGIVALVSASKKQAEYDRGYEAGYNAGYNDGYDYGYDEGYDYGYEDSLYDDTEMTWLTEVESPTHYAIIDIADYGQITVALDGNSAPETVENFVTLAEEGFYDGLTFHRIIEGFMMQGGDPDADGTGGNTDEDGNEINITGEFYYNGYDNYLSHVRGAISMARADDYDSASSQFFIVHEDSTDSLDMLYAAFGYVIEGMDVVDAVCEAAEPTDDNGTIEYEAQPVITTIMIYTAEEYEQLLADSTPDAQPVAIDAKIAEITAINEGMLSLTIYGLTESGAEYEITDLKDVDLTNYEATEETEEYTIPTDIVIYTVVDSALAEIESSEIIVGDMLVIDDGSDEGVTIVVYHIETNQNAKSEDESVTE